MDGGSRKNKKNLYRVSCALLNLTIDKVLVKFDSPANFQYKVCTRLRLILPEVTAIGIRLSHASREGSALGRRLSNTWIICPMVEDNLGKLRIILHRSKMLECT